MTAWGNEHETFAYQCPHCTKPAVIAVLETWIEHRWQYRDREWTTARCQSCLGPLLFERLADVADGQMYPWDPRVLVYPTQGGELSQAVPDTLRQTFTEAVKCMQAGCYTASVIMGRRLVEGLANLNGAQGRTLAAKLAHLKSKGILDARLLEWSDLIKNVGNDGAHETNSAVSRQDAQEVLRFVEALVDYHYTYRAQYDAFVERREASKAAAKEKGSAPLPTPPVE